METLNSLGILILAVLVPGVDKDTKLVWRDNLQGRERLYFVDVTAAQLWMERYAEVRQYGLKGPDGKKVWFWAAYDAQENTLYCQLEQST